MSISLKHLESLLQTSEPSGDKSTGTLSEWERASNDAASLKIQKSTPVVSDDAETSGEDIEDSVLHTFSNGVDFVPSTPGLQLPILSGLFDDPFSSQEVVQTLNAILKRRGGGSIDEAVSEIAELVGYDKLDGILKMLNHRDEAMSEIELLLVQQRDAPKADRSQDGFLKQTDAYSHTNVRQRLQEQLDANANRPLFSGRAEDAPEVLPNVYSSSQMSQGNVVSQFGGKYMLPVGTERTKYDIYEEVIIPPARPIPPRTTERLLPIRQLDELVRGSFPGYTDFNRVQSIVFPTAYNSNENMLICAPTGAGKTEVAMLSVLRVIDQHRRQTPHPRDGIDKHLFKIIYVAPMKALAAEIVRKLGHRLRWLGIEVRELTGDMQLTKAEIARTQLIVTTPEKWDVVTRKPTGEGEMASVIKLLIIDEVHLLNDERGAVIETIVARTQRQVESSQSMIRIVGLSATLPNYTDVADFLCVSRYKGLFYFDSSFRPIPLEQHFIGISGKANSPQSRKNIDAVTFQKVSELVAQGHQVMVFVHARKETVKAATALRETALIEGSLDYFLCEDHPQYTIFRREIGQSRNKEMKQLFDSGFGIHHAGMLRSDRNLMERLFAEKAIKVLCCTATLAWGVNLPAHAVVIKGTQVYDSAKGKFVDLSVLDVLQIFGRAGRPGMETSGEGFILTPEEKLTHYLDAVMTSIPIESQFLAGIVDSLNAEIALGTVATVQDAVQWLGYTYLFVRMRKNPFVYGIPRETLLNDPILDGKRTELAIAAAKKLSAARMITFDSHRHRFQITDLGRIAAKYYIRSASVEIFNEKFRPRMSEADVLAMLSESTEFDQIQVREAEQKELEQIMERIPCQVNGIDRPADKTNILLQGYISNEVLEDFALVSDMAYVAQNAGRIIRALLEIAMSKKWASVTATLLGLCKAIDLRFWPYEHPLRQMKLKPETLYSLEKWADDFTVGTLAVHDPGELGRLIHLNEHHGAAVVNAAKQFPTLRLLPRLQPVTPEVLKVTIDVLVTFDWNPRIHDVETFYVWIEDNDGLMILQLARVVAYADTKATKVVFYIPTPSDAATGICLRYVSDRWMGSDEKLDIDLDSVILPSHSQPSSKLLSLPFLSINSVNAPNLFQDLFAPSKLILNSLQTQAFWSIVYSKHNALLCAPMGSGKSTLSQMAAWMAVLRDHKCSVLVIVPSRSAANELLTDMRRASELCQIPLIYSNADTGFTNGRSRHAIHVVTADQLLNTISKTKPEVQDLRLVICEGLEQLTPHYELAVSMLLYATQASNTRFVGISSSVSDADSLAKWLRVEPLGLTNFRPQDRDQSLTSSTQTFSIPHSASLFKAMAKPAHRAIVGTPSSGSTIVFVPSRGQCRLIAQDLITQCTLEAQTTRGYLGDTSDETISAYAYQLHDLSLADFVTKGVGFFHRGIHREDQALMLALFAEDTLRVLITPLEACWDIPVRAHCVVVLGTQFVRTGEHNTARQIEDYTISELARMQSRAVQQAASGHFHLFCQAESRETYSKFLDEGLPLESALAESAALRHWARRFRDEKFDRQGIMNALSFTFLARRVVQNPSFYGFPSRDQAANLSAIVDKLEKDLNEAA